MNGNYYQNPTFPNNNAPMNNQNYTQNQNENNQQMPEIEMSYIENILRNNKGKTVHAYFSYPDAEKWKNMDYFGTIEEAGIDHLIIRDSSNGSYYLLRMIYLDYFEFLEPINYR